MSSTGTPASSAVCTARRRGLESTSAGRSSPSIARSARACSSPAGGQRQVGAAGVLPAAAPLGLAMADQPELHAVGQPRGGLASAGSARELGLHGSLASVAHAAFLVSQKIVSISAIRSSSFWPSAGSTDALAAGRAGRLGRAVEQVVQVRVLLEVLAA